MARNPYALDLSGLQQGLQIGGHLSGLMDARQQRHLQQQQLGRQEDLQGLLQNPDADLQQLARQFPEQTETIQSLMQIDDDYKSTASKEEKMNVNRAANNILLAHQTNDVNARLTSVRNNADLITEVTGDPEMPTLLENIAISDPDQFGKIIKNISDGTSDISRPASIQEYEQLISDSQSDDEVRKNAARIKLGLDPRATGSASQTIADRGTAEEVSAVEQTIAGGRERGKRIVEGELSPAIARNVELAKAQGKDAAEVEVKARQNQQKAVIADNTISDAMTAWNAYSVGMTPHSIAGRLPATSTAAQEYEGMKVFLGSVAKEAVRGTGEGAWTDYDQQFLNQSFPSRKDTPEAGVRKLNNLRTWLNYKMGIMPEDPEGILAVSNYLDKKPEVPTPQPGAEDDAAVAGAGGQEPPPTQPGTVQPPQQPPQPGETEAPRPFAQTSDDDLARSLGITLSPGRRLSNIQIGDY